MEGIQLPARKKGQGKRATCSVPLQLLKTLDSVLEVVLHGSSQGCSVMTVEKTLEVRRLPGAGLTGSLPCRTQKRRVRAPSQHRSSGRCPERPSQGPCSGRWHRGATALAAPPIHAPLPRGQQGGELLGRGPRARGAQPCSTPLLASPWAVAQPPWCRPPWRFLGHLGRSRGGWGGAQQPATSLTAAGRRLSATVPEASLLSRRGTPLPKHRQALGQSHCSGTRHHFPRQSSSFSLRSSWRPSWRPRKWLRAGRLWGALSA